MKKAIILHTIEDAKYCIKKNLHVDALLFCSHCAVQTYLEVYHAISCPCLTEFFTTEEHCRDRIDIENKVTKVIEALDKHISGSINEIYGLNIDYFRAFYGYNGILHYHGLYLSFEGIRRLINKYGIEKIIMFDFGGVVHFRGASFRENCAYVIPKNITIEFINASSWIPSFYQTFAKGCLKIISLAKSFSRKINIIIKDFVFKQAVKKLSKNKSTIIIEESLYDLEFLREELPDQFNILFTPITGNGPLGLSKYYDVPEPEIVVDFKKFCFIEHDEDPIWKIFFRDIQHDFEFRFHRSLKTVLEIKEISKDYPPILAIWGMPPNEDTRALITAYCQSVGIPVIGAQHGGNYGERFQRWHAYADYSRCDYFLSYGFDQQDLERTIVDKDLSVKIVPVGRARMIATPKMRKDIDILFPMTDNRSSFCISSAIRILPHELNQRQVKIIQYLDSLKELKTFCKPMAFSDHTTSSVLPLLKQLTNAKACFYDNLSNFLCRYKPKAIVIEYPSTPFYEVIHMDIEIFLMHDPVNPFEPQALEMLKRRVHYAETIDELIRLLEEFRQGRLEKKRDQSFWEHYLYRPDPKQNIRSFIQQIVNQSCKFQGPDQLKASFNS